MSAPRYALIATVSFHGAVVEQRQLRRGAPVVIGRDDSLAIPLPAGVPYLAECRWVGTDRVRVTDGRGRVHEVLPDADLSIALGPVQLELALAQQFPLRRSMRLDTVLSAAWLAIVLMATNASSSGMLIYDNYCEWGVPLASLVAEEVGPGTPFVGRCFEPESSSSGLDVTAEYLARLLREDYAGDDEGMLVQEIDRPEAEKKEKRIYMPAGNTGPVDEMGGAEDQSPDPVRTPEEVAEPKIDHQGGQPEPLYAEEVGTPIALPEAKPDEEKGDDGIVMEEEPEEIDALEAPSEEVRGWGVRDWYDESDAAMENVEIELMLDAAKRVLKIDPDDPSALSILSYYQYLAQDYDAALDTYDRYISLFPDSAAGYNNKALVYKRQGDYEIEERLYRVALALEPDDVTAMNNLAVNLAHQGRFDEAVAIMVELERLDPDDAYADLHRSKIYAAMDQNQLALEYLDKSLTKMKQLDTLHHIEFRQDIRVDPAFAKLRETREFRDVLVRYYGKDTPLQEG